MKRFVNAMTRFFMFKFLNDNGVKYDLEWALTECAKGGLDGFENITGSNYGHDQLLKSVEVREHRCTNAGDIKRWGSLIDFHLYALVYKKNVRILCTFPKVGIVEISGAHRPLTKFNFDTAHQDAMKNSELFLYVNGNHYDPIPKLREGIYWKCSDAFTRGEGFVPHVDCIDCVGRPTNPYESIHL